MPWYNLRSWTFLAAALATFADYLGLALMQPALPFYLTEIGVVGREPIALWNGAINTAQFIAVVFGNIVWGLVGDHFGSAMAIRLAMAGDTVFFALTGFITSPPLLAVVRFFAGLSTPLVPSLLYIFERATSPAQAVRGVSWYVNAILLGYVAGGIIVSAGYDALGFRGLNLVTTGVCAYALFHSTAFSAPSPLAGQRPPKPAGLRNALKTAAFLNHCVIAYVQGSAFSMFLMTIVLMLKDEFDSTPTQACVESRALEPSHTFIASHAHLTPSHSRLVGCLLHARRRRSSSSRCRASSCASTRPSPS